MPTVQKTYTRVSPVAYPGMIADIDSTNRVVSRVAEVAIEFGLGVFHGTNKAEQVKLAGVAPTSGSVTDTTTYAVADQDTKTIQVSVDNGPTQTLTFSGATTTAAGVVTALLAQIKGIAAAVVGGQVKITSLSSGAGSSVRIVGGTSDLTWADAVQGKDVNFVGVAVRSHTNIGGSDGTYDANEVAGIIVEGPVWVEFETVANPGDPITVDITTGKFGTAPADATHAPIKAELATVVATVDQLAILKLQANK